MKVEDPALIRMECHAHTEASKDSLVRPGRLIQHCQKIGIHKIAITDHNEIEGALAAQALAPDRVIVGEEIETTQGELIGYFMREWVPPALAPMAAIERLREQGAVISVAHPFDTIRSKHWKQEDLLAIVPHIDAIEVFNARCLRNQPNQEAEAFAKQHDLLATVGSDAHSLYEVGTASLQLPAFSDAASFTRALAEARHNTRLSPAFVHLFSRFATFYKRLTRLLGI